MRRWAARGALGHKTKSSSYARTSRLRRLRLFARKGGALKRAKTHLLNQRQLTTRRLSRRFFERDPVVLARDLLGRILFYRTPEGLVAGRIVETEAYTGNSDPASHAYRGRTARNAVMFGKAGHAYVYFTYGMHYCLNVTAEKPGTAGAVLLRALEPLAGVDLMRARGDHGAEARLLSGPGKIGRAFGLTLADNGRDFTRGPLGIAEGTPVEDHDVAISKRIGISRAVDLPYRFTVVGNRSVSKAPSLPSPASGGGKLKAARGREI